MNANNKLNLHQWWLKQTKHKKYKKMFSKLIKFCQIKYILRLNFYFTTIIIFKDATKIISIMQKQIIKKT